MIKLIIFDIGGVLLDYKEEWYIRYIAEKYKLNYSKLKRTMFPIIAKMEEDRAKVGELEETISKTFHIPLVDLEWNSAFEKFAEFNGQMLALVRRLAKRYNVVLLTNISRSRYANPRIRAVRRLKLRAFASCFLKMSKPNPRIYRFVLKSMHTLPGEAIFIDDREENVRGARGVGIHAVHFRNYGNLVRWLDKYKVKTR